MAFDGRADVVFVSSLLYIWESREYIFASRRFLSCDDSAFCGFATAVKSSRSICLTFLGL